MRPRASGAGHGLRTRIWTLLLLALATAVPACREPTPSADERSDPQTQPVPGFGPPPAPPSAPAGWPTTFSVGREATPDEIEAVDKDVRPDGQGLPPGGASVTEGARVFAARCAPCHGPTGTEGPNDRLVGREPREGFPFGAERGRYTKTVGNYWPYATTLFDYVTRTMPLDSPGSLTPDEVYAVVAYVLYLNEIISGDAVMNPETLPAVVMPARDRFVPDDRTGGPEVR